MSSTADPPKAPAASAVDPSADEQQLVDGRADIRKLLQRTGAAFGVAATAILTGLGYGQLHHIFPIPHNVNWWFWDIALIASMVAAGLGSLFVGAIFLRAQRQIVLDSDDSPEDSNWRHRRDLNKHEARLVNKIRWEHAHEEMAKNLRAVELRALRLERLSRRPHYRREAKALQKEADRLYGVVSIAISRASTSVLEDRSRRAFFNRRTFAAVAVALLGITGIFGIADYFKGERDKVALRVACQKAEEANIAGACAPIESADERKMRMVAEKAATAAATASAAAAAAQARRSLTGPQRALLAKLVACDAAIAALPNSKGLSAATHTEAVALCAAAR